MDTLSSAFNTVSNKINMNNHRLRRMILVKTYYSLPSIELFNFLTSRLISLASEPCAPS